MRLFKKPINISIIVLNVFKPLSNSKCILAISDLAFKLTCNAHWVAAEGCLEVKTETKQNDSRGHPTTH